jgi:hypothetical protein
MKALHQVLGGKKVSVMLDVKHLKFRVKILFCCCVVTTSY